MGKNVLTSGAEAMIIRSDDNIVKHRLVKSYRLKSIDDRLRKSRTRREAKVLERLHGVIDVPSLFEIDDKDMCLKMEYISGKKIRDVLTKKNYRGLMKKIAKNIAIMHDQDIIHGDLTTSNFILDPKSKKVFFIDFGLSFFSKKIEDKAVDLHLLKQALESKHHDVSEKAYEVLISEYKKTSALGEEVIARLRKVENRGRNKTK